MEKQAQAGKATHPLILIAGIAVILFCAAGTAAIMGWVPTSIGSQEPTAKEQADKIGEKKSPAAAKQAVVRPQTPLHMANAAPAKAKVKPKCNECGVVQGVREVEKNGEGTGLGAVGGAVVGGVVGHQMGNGRGQDVMTVVGAVGGGLAGHQIEKKVRTSKNYEVTVRFEDGSQRTVSEAKQPNWRAGDKVKLVNGVLQANS
jgi:outer membrane lipoprotein SlyB